MDENKAAVVRDVAEVDWATWVPKETAVLCFVRDGENVLLINKKTGLGKGKVNAPGGRIEKGECALDAAIRETREETQIVPSRLNKVAELFFIFTDGYSLHGTVFFADSFTGTPVETIEADPFWCKISELPFDRMWEDDRHWLPLIFSGKSIKGYFVFDNDTMLSKSVIVTEF